MRSQERHQAPAQRSPVGASASSIEALRILEPAASLESAPSMDHPSVQEQPPELCKLEVAAACSWDEAIHLGEAGAGTHILAMQPQKSVGSSAEAILAGRVLPHHVRAVSNYDDTLLYHGQPPQSVVDETIKYGDDTIKYEGLNPHDDSDLREEDNNATLLYPSPFFSAPLGHPSSTTRSMPAAQQPPIVKRQSRDIHGVASVATPQKVAAVSHRFVAKDKAATNIATAQADEWLVPMKRRRLEAATVDGPKARMGAGESLQKEASAHQRLAAPHRCGPTPLAQWMPERSMPRSGQKAKQITLAEAWRSNQTRGQE